MNDLKELQELFSVFSDQFGEKDIHLEILLEVLFEELKNQEKNGEK